MDYTVIRVDFRLINREVEMAMHTKWTLMRSTAVFELTTDA